MNAQAIAAALSPWGRLKRALFLALGLMFVFVLWRSERFIVDHSHPDWAYYSPVLWWLVPHGLGGLIALVTGPFQFSSRFRQRHLDWHRGMVRSYAITTTFVTTRVLTAIPSIGGGGEVIYVPAQWSLLVATMVLAELGLTWRALSASARPSMQQG